MNKTQWLIKGTNKTTGKTEVLDSYETVSEAIKMRYQYQLAYGVNWTISVNKKV